MNPNSRRQAAQDVIRLLNASDRLRDLLDENAVLRDNLRIARQGLKVIQVWATLPDDKTLRQIRERAADLLHLAAEEP